MKFQLTIELGNDAMSDAPAIADALQQVAATLNTFYVGCDPIEATTPGELGTTIIDFNGATVGKWEVTA